MLMTDDEMSELAEALAYACDEWIAEGGTIGQANTPRGPRLGCRCPFGALLPPSPRGVRTAFPESWVASKRCDVDVRVVESFMHAFDGVQGGCRLSPRAYDLGVSFRERYVEGAAP